MIRSEVKTSLRNKAADVSNGSGGGGGGGNNKSLMSRIN